MMRGEPQRLHIRRRISPRRLEREDAGVRHPDVGGWIVRLRTKRLRKRSMRAHDRVPIERLERPAPFDKRPIWREERIERSVGLPRLPAFNRRAETISAPRQRLDVLRSVRLITERL